MVLYQKGSETAFSHLYNRYQGRIYGMIRRKVFDQNQAQDVFQKVFLKLHQSRAQFDPDLIFSRWIFTVTSHVIIDHLRQLQSQQKGLGRPVPEEALEQVPVAVDVPTPQVDTSGLSQAAQDLLKLRFDDDLEFSVIAEKLNITESAVRKQLSRIYQALRSSKVKA